MNKMEASSTSKLNSSRPLLTLHGYTVSDLCVWRLREGLCSLLTLVHSSFNYNYLSLSQGSESPMMLGDSKSDLEDVDP